MNNEGMTRATDKGRPGDLMWGGLFACVVGGIAGGVALAKDHPTAASVAIIVFGVAAQVLIGIAVVAFGVSLGIRHADAKRLEGSETTPPRVPTQRGRVAADGSPRRPVPPWDTPEGRSYR